MRHRELFTTHQVRWDLHESQFELPSAADASKVFGGQVFLARFLERSMESGEAVGISPSLTLIWWDDRHCVTAGGVAV